MALLHRAMFEQNGCLKWLLWPLDFHALLAESWTFSKQIWRVLFIPAFKKGDGLIRVSFLRIFLRLLKTETFLESELVQISISLAAFNRVIRDSTPTQEGLEWYTTILFDIENELFLQNPEEIMKIQNYFSAHQNSINDMVESGDQNAMSQFATELDVTLTQLTQLPPYLIVGDWILNFLFVYRQILSKIPDSLLQKAFRFTLLRRATDEGICAILDLLRQVGVSKDSRFVLQQFLPSERIDRLLKSCPASLAKIPQLVPYNVRKAHFLALSRGFADVSIVYRLPQTANRPDVDLMSLLVAVEEMEIDVFETQNMIINGHPLKVVLEGALSTFAKVPFWSIPGPNGSFFPSPMLQPRLLVSLFLLMIRCRQLNCRSSLKLAKEFFTAEVSEIKSKIASYLMSAEDSSWPVIHDGYLRFFDRFISIAAAASSNILAAEVELERAWSAVGNQGADGVWVSDQFYQAFENRIEKIVQLQIDTLGVVFNVELKHFEMNEYFKLLFE
jgi:hypothetical protein